MHQPMQLGSLILPVNGCFMLLDCRNCWRKRNGQDAGFSISCAGIKQMHRRPSSHPRMLQMRQLIFRQGPAISCSTGTSNLILFAGFHCQKDYLVKSVTRPTQHTCAWLQPKRKKYGTVDKTDNTNRTAAGCLDRLFGAAG